MRIVFEYLMVAAGCVIMALGFNTFCIPHNIAPGGFSGLGAIIYYVTGFPAGTATFLLCAPLFFFVLKDYGVTHLVKTIYGTGVFSVALDLTAKMEGVVNDIFLGSVFGGITLGLGLGIVFLFNGNTGGTDLLAILIQKKIKRVPVSTCLMCIDLSIVIFAGVVLKNIEVSLYSMITLYTSMRMVRFIETGIDYSKAFYIFTEKPLDIKNEIYKKLDRGVTLLKAVGGYGGEEKNVILCVVNRPQIFTLKQIIKETDPDAFVILADVNEVIGEGFHKDRIK
jgi:uncharacterized membrane-anchored protein YitT (DUF2179 family)